MPFQVELTPKAFEDLEDIKDLRTRDIILKALKKLEIAPREYGKPYRDKLSDYYKLRTAQSYRIIYEIRETAGEVTVHVISIRSKVYDIAYKRLVKT